MSPLLFLIPLIWLIATCVRIYQQARFFQIEEYMPTRYARWLFGTRPRWLPTRPAVAFGATSAFSLFLSEAPGNFFPFILAIIAGMIAMIPQRTSEIKKVFRLTPRAKRLLGTAFGIIALVIAVGALIVSRLPIAPESEYAVVALSAVGFLGFLFAPCWLMLGNMLMVPIETVSRKRFIASARAILDEIDPIRIGITGSYGKTSTKVFLAHLLNGRAHAYATPKSYNTLMGICLAINNDLADDRRTDTFIAEMGAYIPGEIARICQLVRPTIGIIIDIGPQHLERFGTLDNVATAKYELIRALPPEGIGIFNADNPAIRAMIARGVPQTRIAVSKADSPPDIPELRFVASQIEETLNGVRFIVTDRQTDETEAFNTSLAGEHNVTNILLATAAAVTQGMTLREVARRAVTLQPAESRLVRQMTENGITILNDAYSANPVGIVSALKTLRLHEGGRRLLITPGMVELGERMAAENHRLGMLAADAATDVILVGETQTAPIREGLLSTNFDANHLHIVDTLSEAIAWYQNHLRTGDTVMFMNDLPDTYAS